jgi:glutamate-1-semialdehyde 2,1-aminomutase
MQTQKLLNSKLLMQRAQQVIPGGVNSPVRAFKSVGGQPVFFKRGAGAYMYDADDNSYIDYVGSWGPLILGHAHPEVISAIAAAIQNGLSFGAPTLAEVELAELITKLMPSVEMVRMTSSGTEATMSAIRLARGYSGKTKLLKFDNCYHGHSDSLLVKAGSGILTLGIAGSAGITLDTAQQTIVVPYNDLAATQAVFAEHGHDIAAIIVEPLAANTNLILPKPGFLAGLRALCDEYNSVLIFDEVITGFRVALGGAQQLYGISADITCLGKIIGGGMPVGAFGGRKDIFAHLAPLGPVYQAGTLSGNPIAMTAGLATLKELQKPGVYEKLAKACTMLTQGIAASAAANDIQLEVNQVGSIFGISFLNDPVQKSFKKFFHLMLEQGIYLAPSAFEVGFVSLAHDEQILANTLQAVENSFAQMLETELV